MTTHTPGTCHFCAGPNAELLPHFGIYYDGCEKPRGVLRVWSLNNLHWGDRPSEICACNQHTFEQREGVSVLVCVCGKWPAHHSHVGESYRTCGCDGCRWLVEMGMPEPALTARETGMIIPISHEQLMDCGLIPDTRPPLHIPWRRRLRWAIHERIRQTRLHVGSWIAGEPLDPDQHD